MGADNIFGIQRLVDVISPNAIFNFENVSVFSGLFEIACSYDFGFDEKICEVLEGFV